MVSLRITTREGDKKIVESAGATTLMALLRSHDMGVPGTCGGMCSCGSCHVIISEAMQAVLAPPDEDEQDMLDALADAVDIRPGSRLSCKIPITPEMDGLALEIGPQI